MSLQRWLTDAVDFYRTDSGYLPSGERRDVYTAYTTGVQCRIRQISMSDLNVLAPQVTATATNTALFAPGIALPKINERVRRVADGQVYEVIGIASRQGDIGHAMEHQIVTLREVGT